MGNIYQHPQLASLFQPTRRAIFERIARGASTVRQIADDLDLVPLEVTRHVRDLIDVGLVTAEGSGEEVRYRVDRGGVASMGRVLDAAWTRTLAGMIAATRYA